MKKHKNSMAHFVRTRFTSILKEAYQQPSTGEGSSLRGARRVFRLPGMDRELVGTYAISLALYHKHKNEIDAVYNLRPLAKRSNAFTTFYNAVSIVLTEQLRVMVKDGTPRKRRRFAPGSKHYRLKVRQRSKPSNKKTGTINNTKLSDTDRRAIHLKQAGFADETILKLLGKS